VSTAAPDTRPVGSAELADLARLFETERNTRRCWCTAFCTSGSQFARGWLTGGNRRRFEALAEEGTAEDGTAPMGILASLGGEPVGWCACGPRSRYTAAIGGRSRLLQDRPRDEDDLVWLLPCLFVRDGHRGQGVTYALARAAVELARREGAVAIEGWPSVGAAAASAEGFLGREQLFEDLGFQAVARPSPQRVVMRLELQEQAAPSS
jgi:GNAT superfamily N-acetyltransferase